MITHEKHLDSFCTIAKKYVKNSNPTIVEIGARDCSETLAFLNHFPSAKIFSFECNPDTLPLCKEKFSSHKNIILIEKAVTDKDGRITFLKIDKDNTRTIHADGNPGASSVFEANPDYEPEKYVQMPIGVESTRLDSFFRERNLDKVDLLWMDIQGSELSALSGAGDYLSKISIIHTEVEFFPIYKNQPLYRDIKKFLNQKGFKLLAFTTLGRYAGDAVFIKKDLCKKIAMPEFIIDGFYRVKQKIISRLSKSYLKQFAREHHILTLPIIQAYILLVNISKIFTERKARLDYKEKIGESIKNKEIVFNIEFGGLGDWLALTSMPRLLKEKHDIDFYLSEESIKNLRNHDTYRLCFEKNPYVKGIRKGGRSFSFKIFSLDKSFWHLISDRGSRSITEIIEKQFGVSDRGLPELYYKPNLLPEYANVILIDKNYIAGKIVGWKYDDSSFEREKREYLTPNTRVEYIDPSKQDLFKYIDMIWSCKHFITVLSGGAALAACFKKPFTVILPYNVFGEGVDQFVFKNSSGKYIK